MLEIYTRHGYITVGNNLPIVIRECEGVVMLNDVELSKAVEPWKFPNAAALYDFLTKHHFQDSTTVGAIGCSADLCHVLCAMMERITFASTLMITAQSSAALSTNRVDGCRWSKLCVDSLPKRPFNILRNAACLYVR